MMERGKGKPGSGAQLEPDALARHEDDEALSRGGVHRQECSFTRRDLDGHIDVHMWSSRLQPLQGHRGAGILIPAAKRPIS